MDLAFQTVGIKREEVYITNIVKCRPPGNRNPEDDEAVACLNYLRNQVMLVKPKVIVLLGSVALKNILGKEYGITQSRGKWIEKKGISYMPTWHPAALLRDETKKINFINDLKLVTEKMQNIKIEEINKKAEYCLNCKIKPCSRKRMPIRQQHSSSYFTNKRK